MSAKYVLREEANSSENIAARYLRLDFRKIYQSARYPSILPKRRNFVAHDKMKPDVADRHLL